MGDPYLHPLSTEEAKERLRRAAENAGLAGLIRRHPYQALLIAGLAGLVLGSEAERRDLLIKTLLRRLG
jgi:ElaB/YqjD/DUF883 family membrane-anchored ribosome-binding protein